MSPPLSTSDHCVNSCRNLHESDWRLMRWTDLDTVLLFPDPVEFILLPPSLNRLLFWSAARPKLHTYINKQAEMLTGGRERRNRNSWNYLQNVENLKESTHQDSVLLLLDWRWLAAEENKKRLIRLKECSIFFLILINFFSNWLMNKYKSENWKMQITISPQSSG